MSLTNKFWHETVPTTLAKMSSFGFNIVRTHVNCREKLKSSY